MAARPRTLSLAGVRFCIAGEDLTRDLSNEMFYGEVSGIVEAAGGRVTGGVSGVTDYLVVGTTHYNSFTGVRGPMSNSAKVRDAKERGAAIITAPQLNAGIAQGTLACKADRSPVKKPKAKAAPKAKAGGKPAAAKSSRGARKKKEPAEEDQYGDY